MSITGTTTYTVSRDQIIAYALRKIGALALGTTVDATTIAAYTDPLNMMIKSWITKGIKLWTIEELTLPLVGSQNWYVIGNTGTTERGTPSLVSSKPMKLKQCFLRNVQNTPSNDIPVMVTSQYDYNMFGSKLSTGVPNTVYLDVGREQSTVKMYPTPDVIAATTYQLHLITQRQLFDMTASTDNFDFPVEALYCLGWNFAAEIMTDFGVEQGRMQYIESKAMKLLAEWEDFDTEYNSIYLQPDMRSRQTK